jgi:hypothetical protein
MKNATFWDVMLGGITSQKKAFFKQLFISAQPLISKATLKYLNRTN